MTNEHVLDRALGAYLGFACGDALGATVEFMTPKQIHKHYGVHQDIIGGGWLNLEAGQVNYLVYLARMMQEMALVCEIYPWCWRP